MMPLLIVAVSLRRDDFGAFRITDIRILLELIFRVYHAGATPERIVQACEALKLRDVDAVVACCLNNESSVTDHMTDREMRATAVQGELEVRCCSKDAPHSDSRMHR